MINTSLMKHRKLSDRVVQPILYSQLIATAAEGGVGRCSAALFLPPAHVTVRTCECALAFVQYQRYRPNTSHLHLSFHPSLIESTLVNRTDKFLLISPILSPKPLATYTTLHSC